MFIFLAYRFIKTPSPSAYSKTIEVLSEKGQSSIEISCKKLDSFLSDHPNFDSTKSRTQYICTIFTRKNDIGPKEKKFIAYIRTHSNLILLDTEGSVEYANFLLDIFEDKWNASVEPINPTIDGWIQFLKTGHLHRAVISTRYGFEEVTQKKGFSWDSLRFNPLIS